MGRDEAMALLHRLHSAQNLFHAGGDNSALHELLTDDIAWHVPGRNAIAGHYRGIDSVLGYFRKRRDLAGRTFRVHTRDVLSGDGEWISAITDGTAVVGGHEYAWSTAGLYQVRGQRISACRLLPFDADEFDAIWAHRGQATSSVSQVRVRPRHCDAQGMLHAARYYEYFEDAFLGWLDDHAGGYRRLREAGTDLVIVSSGCDHRHGAALDDLLTIEVRPTATVRSSLTVSFTVQHDDQILAIGRTTYVAVRDGNATELPEVLAGRAVRPSNVVLG
jgi:YbgC/YbaW family acyl-CoA thioester hydrolase